MPLSFVRMLDQDEKADPNALAMMLHEELGLEAPPEVRLVKRSHPHVAFRHGFPEMRLVLAYAPHAVITNQTTAPWAKFLAQAGVPIKTLDEIVSKPPKGEATWTRPLLNGAVLERLKTAERVTVLGEGVAPREGDGLTVGVDPFCAFANPAPDFYLLRRRVLHVPFPDMASLNLVAPPEDAFTAGQPCVPVLIRPAYDVTGAIVRSSALWPSTGLTGHSGTLVSAAEAYRTEAGIFSWLPELFIVAARKQGFKGPITYRMPGRQMVVPIDPAQALSLHHLMERYELEIKNDGEPHTKAKPLAIKVEFREAQVAFLASAVAEWVDACRGAAECTWVSGSKDAVDFLASRGYSDAQPPTDTPEMTLSLPDLVPLV